MPQPPHLLARFQQIIQLALRDDAPILHHDDVIGAAQGDFAMRHDQASRRIRAFAVLEDARLQCALGFHSQLSGFLDHHWCGPLKNS